MPTGIIITQFILLISKNLSKKKKRIDYEKTSNDKLSSILQRLKVKLNFSYFK